MYSYRYTFEGAGAGVPTHVIDFRNGFVQEKMLQYR